MKFSEIFARYKEAKQNVKFSGDVLAMGAISRRDREKYEKLRSESSAVVKKFEVALAQLDETEQELISRAYLNRTYNWHIRRAAQMNMSKSKLYRMLDAACKKIEDMW